MPAAPADVLVIFGITGDLAKVMTFHALYRLEQQGLLHCPVVGVAAQDWTVDRLRERARSSIRQCSIASRPGSATSREISRTHRPTGAWRTPSRARIFPSSTSRS